jgi:GT2 family glycosyltransferase
MMPQKIERQVWFLDMHPECEITYSSLYHFIEGTSDLYLLPLPQVSSDTLFELFTHGNFINPNTVMMRRSLFDRIGGFDEALLRTEDLAYWLFLARKNTSFMYQDEKLTLYRVRRNSISSDSILLYECGVAIFEYYLNYEHRDDILLAIKMQLKLYRLRLAFAYLKKGERKKSFALVSDRPLFLVPFLFLSLFPSSLISMLYAFLQKVRFNLRFSTISDPRAAEVLRILDEDRDFLKE